MALNNTYDTGASYASTWLVHAASEKQARGGPSHIAGSWPLDVMNDSAEDYFYAE